MITAYGVVGDGWRFRFGIKSDDDKLMELPLHTATAELPDMERAIKDYPNENAAKPGEWCWRHERTPDGV